jgi:hypothetical protein
MKFVITMNMPAKSGTSVHQIVADYPVNGLKEFLDALTDNDFLMIEEYYKNPNDSSYYSNGFVGINYRYVGKVKVLNNKY